MPFSVQNPAHLQMRVQGKLLREALALFTHSIAAGIREQDFGVTPQDQAEQLEEQLRLMVFKSPVVAPKCMGGNKLFGLSVRRAGSANQLLGYTKDCVLSHDYEAYREKIDETLFYTVEVYY